MMIGLGTNNRTYIASETSAFSKYTKNFIAMKDGEIGIVRPNGTSLDITAGNRLEVAPEHDVLLTPHPHPHFTIKELLEQPEAIARALAYGARMDGYRVVLGGFDKNKDIVGSIRNLLLTGCGTSKFAAEYAAKLMRELDCLDTVTVLDSAEVRRCDIPKLAGGVLAVSQSGETKDVHRAIKTADEVGVPCISAVNVVGSLIARTTGLGVYLNAGEELFCMRPPLLVINILCRPRACCGLYKGVFEPSNGAQLSGTLVPTNERGTREDRTHVSSAPRALGMLAALTHFFWNGSPEPGEMQTCRPAIVR
jgi:glucosamine--fructose-6-phosphate aminotransferase (isomerizing)